jgi:hypothetical protein
MTTPNTMEPEVRKVFSAPETGDYGAGASGAEFTQAYMNDFTMYPQQETLRSQRRTGDGQRDKGRLGRHNNTGEMNCELIVGVHDKYLEAVLGATFPTTGGGSLITPITAATIACVASGSQITDSGSGLGDLVDGMFVDVSGFTQNSGENNGIYYVSSPSASAATLYRVDGGSMTDEVAGDSVTITQLDMVANGRAVPSYEFEDVHDDVSPNVFKNYPGTVLPDFSLNFNNEIATARFGLLSPVAAISGAAARSGSLAYPSSRTRPATRCPAPLASVVPPPASAMRRLRSPATSQGPSRSAPRRPTRCSRVCSSATAASLSTPKTTRWTRLGGPRPLSRSSSPPPTPRAGSTSSTSSTPGSLMCSPTKATSRHRWTG